MAVEDSKQFWPSEGLVAKRGRKRYHVKVRSQHWQLRSLISAEKLHHVYFPGGNKSNYVQRLNTLTRECETIKFLTFPPRCLVADNGWLCCGSETGEFVAIRLDEATEGRTSPAQDSTVMNDVSQSSNSSDSPTEEAMLSLLTQARPSNKSLMAKSMKLAKERVNCVTLWSPAKTVPAVEQAYQEEVAVLANNDLTVVLVSLSEFDRSDKIEPLDVVVYPDFVNRAIISPDGRFLIAILDDPYLYVHERVQGCSPPAANSRSSGYQWDLRQRVLLKSQRKEDRSDNRGSFAACFSPSGSLLAVGTQHGTISIFDVSSFSDPDLDPLITTFRSSRAESGPGAVRDMAFCPGPFDLLAWTEDRGHIGFADIRSGFLVRQIVDVNAEADFEHIDVLDRSAIDPRLQPSHEEPAVPQRDSSGGGQEDLSEFMNQPFTADETLVLNAMQGGRRQRERMAARASEQFTGDPVESSNTYFVSLQNAVRNDAASPTAGGPSRRMVEDMLNSYREQRDRARFSRQLVREISEQRQNLRRHDPRTRRTIPEAMAALREGQGANHLHLFELLQASESLVSEGSPLDELIVAPIVATQARNRWEESAIRGTLEPRLYDVDRSPDNTAGLSWTADGRTLYVAAENGIYAIPVNVQNRKLCPRIVLR